MSAADTLIKLMEGAAELPWKVNHRRNGNGRPGAMFLRSAAADYLAIAHICQRVDREQTAALIVYLANNAEAIRDLIVAAEKIERIGCMGGDGEIWCKGDAHSIYCPAGIAKNALAKIQP